MRWLIASACRRYHFGARGTQQHAKGSRAPWNNRQVQFKLTAQSISSAIQRSGFGHMDGHIGHMRK
eukprot:2837384-Alexandrium_andersonii.AAC.1